MKVIEIKSNGLKPKKNASPKKVKETNPYFNWYKSGDNCWEVINEYENDEEVGRDG